jgi:adenine-specific DNA-methyltransferase
MKINEDLQKKIEDLQKEVELLKKELKDKKHYGIVFEPKIEEVVEMCKKKLPVLKEVKDKEIITDKNKPLNLLIEGDNYHALSVLNYTHAGKIDFIYIDPPYNTGARDWMYNNNYVDISDPFRHSKWISLMCKRLKLAKNLLKQEGVICVTIDDNELAPLWMLMNEIFGESNHLGTVIIRNNPKGRMTDRKVSLIHEYALFFGRSPLSTIKKLPVAPEEKTHNYKKDKDGSWYLPVNLRKQGVDSTATNRKGILSERYYPIYFDPKTGQVSTQKKLKVEILPIDQRGEKRIWRRSKDVIDEMYEKGDLWVQKTNAGYQVYFKFRGGLEGQMPKSIWYDAKYSASEYGTQILDSIMGAREMFQYPKSPYAVKDCILAGTNKKDAIILDFFAGSGTTAQAVLELNKEDGGNRQFILCTNNENNICTDVCYPRIKKVIEGYKNLKGEWAEGLGGNLKYFKTDFVDAEPTDKNKIKLTKQAIEMLCIKEGTFELVQDKDSFKIFKNNKHYTGIIFDQAAISEFKKTIENIDRSFSVYVFSLSDETFDEEFSDVRQKVKLSPIPEAILRVYRGIFK